MALADMALLALERIISASPVTISIGSNSATCARTGCVANITMSEFGQSKRYKFSVIGKLADLGNVENNSKLKIGTETYRVLGVEDDSVGVSRKLHLGAEYS